MREIGYCCSLMKTRTATHSWVTPHTIDSVFCVFLSDICCKINKLFRHFEYQLTKHDKTLLQLEGRLEGFKISSWFLKIMKIIKYRIARKCHDFHHCCRWLHYHYSRGCHVRIYLNSLSLWRLDSKSVISYWFLKNSFYLRYLLQN